MTPLLRARGLSAPGLFEGVDVEVREGSLVLVEGPNGAGKSTLLAMLLGIRGRGAGTVERAPGTTVGYLPQLDPGDDGPPLSALAVVLQGLPELFPGARGRARAEAALRLCGFRAPPARLYRSLSGGERRRALLARALVGDPSLLALDEPLAGLDRAGARELGALVVEQARERGRGVLCVAHGASALTEAADAVVRLGEGP